MDRSLADKNGRSLQDMPPIESRWLHTGRNKIYRVNGYAFCGETDEWHILHVETNTDNQAVGMAVTRGFDNFHGNRETGEKRFYQVV